MVYSKPDRNVFSVLKLIYSTFKNGSRESVTMICKNHSIAKDYASFLIEKKILITTRGGKCGPATRKWIGSPPTLELSQNLVDKFNRLRRESIKATADKTIVIKISKPTRDNLKTHLDEIQIALNTIQKLVSNANKLKKAI